MLLGEITNLQPVTRNNLTGVWFIEPSQHSKHCGFASTVEADYDDFASLINSKIYRSENL